MTTVVIALFSCVLAGAPTVRRLRARHRWFATVARVAAAMERGTGFLTALGATGDPTAETITVAIRKGTRPGSAFRRHAAPESVATALDSAADEMDLLVQLNRNVKEYQEEAFHRLVHLERIMQPAAVALAGAAVIWLVLRVVIPTLLVRLGPISGV
jgi:type II secretory pathway component PulF